jgi:two-component system chemotaxis response regulator CheB
LLAELVNAKINGNVPMSHSTKEPMGQPSVFTCPECHGTLWEIEEAGLLRFRCRVGHAFSAESMAADQDDSVERALWIALRSLEESVALSQQLAKRAAKRGYRFAARRYRERAAHTSENARVLQTALPAAEIRQLPTGTG